jgi:EmrB/QacA subfamily drug resistance transporter
VRNRSPWLALLVVCLGTFAILLDTTIVSVAIPSLLPDLHASFDQALWITNGYLMVFAALLIVASRLGDMFGPRRMFVLGLAVFAVSSALCGAAQSPGQLIAARVVQGVGAAALAPQGLVVIQAVFPRHRMGAAFGIFAAMVGLAAVCGPTVGGLLTTYLSWRWVFYVNLPIAALGIVLSYVFVPEVRTGRRHRLDPVGVLLATAGLAALVYGLIEGQRYDWGTVAGGVTIPEILAAGALILAGFVWWESRQPEPLVPLKLFRNRTFAIMAVLNAVVQFALQSMLTVNAINLQSVLHASAVRAGLTALPMTVALTAMAPFAGRLADRFGGKYVIVAGLVVYAAGITGVALVSSTHATSLTFAPPLLVGGLGMGAIFAPLTTEAVRAAPAALAGAASGILNTGRQLGATLGGAVTGAVLADQLTTQMHQRAVTAAGQLPPAARPAFVNGFDQAARHGLQVGRGQSGVATPAGLPAELAARVSELAGDIYRHAFIAAQRPTLAVPVLGLLAGAALALLVRRGPAPTEPAPTEPAPTEPAAAEPAATPVG